MSEQAGNTPHYNLRHFVWRELTCDDVEVAKTFYGALLGWAFETMDMPHGPYTTIKAGDAMIGGMMKTPHAGMPAYWMSYVSVPDVDAAAEAAKASGGAVVAGPMDIGVGRMAVIADPHGAHLTLWRASAGDGGPLGMPGPGTFCWETLTTPAVDQAKAFYEAVVGWDVIAGPNGPQTPVFAAGEHSVADVQVSAQHPPHWLTYVVAGPLDEFRDKAERLGAKVIVPRIEVPKVGNIALISDPTGAFIGIFEPQMQIA